MTNVKVVWHLDEANRRIGNEAKNRVAEAVECVHLKVPETLLGPRTGRWYKVPGTETLYQASAPGEAPAQATGELRRTIATEVKKEGSSWAGYCGTRLEYGLKLEVGDGKVAPRPWLRPSFEKAEGEIKSILGGSWKI